MKNTSELYFMSSKRRILKETFAFIDFGSALNRLGTDRNVNANGRDLQAGKHEIYHKSVASNQGSSFSSRSIRHDSNCSKHSNLGEEISFKKKKTWEANRPFGRRLNFLLFYLLSFPFSRPEFEWLFSRSNLATALFFFSRFVVISRTYYTSRISYQQHN